MPCFARVCPERDGVQTVQSHSSSTQQCQDDQRGGLLVSLNVINDSIIDR